MYLYIEYSGVGVTPSVTDPSVVIITPYDFCHESKERTEVRGVCPGVTDVYLSFPGEDSELRGRTNEPT